MIKRSNQKGVVLILCMIILALLSTMAVALAGLTSSNLQCSDNQSNANQAFCAATSGTEIMRSVLASAGDANVLDSEPNTFMSSLASYCNDQLPASATLCADDSNCIEVAAISLSNTEAFTTTLTMVTADSNDYDWSLQVSVLGSHQLCDSAVQFTKTLETTYHVTTPSTASSSIGFFDGAIASRGAITATGNVKILGGNHYSEGNVFIDASDCSDSFTISGSSEIDGTVSVVNSDANLVTLNGSISINQDNIPTWWDTRWGGPFDDDDPDILDDCHVFLGVDPIEFPVPNPQAFRDLAPEDGNSVSGGLSGQTLDNVVIAGNISGGPYTINNAFIPANTNPNINGNYTINGLIYIEQPNKVKFSGSVSLNGVIVAEGDYQNEDPTNNTISIKGDTTNNGVDALDEDDPLFEDIIAAAEGISILAPGFAVDIGASFDSVNGGITANGISFSGNPQIIVGGPIINYSTDTMSLTGSTCLQFDLSGYDGTLSSTGFSSEASDENTGFELTYVAADYREL